jgi:IS4 transposase
MDRGYIDYQRLYEWVKRECSFVVRAKDNLRYTVCSARVVDMSAGLRSDETIELALDKAKKAYPKLLRRVRFYDANTQLDLVFLSNHFDLDALTIAAIYKQRWQIELFFKWLKQNLSVKHFFGNSLNAVKTQIWIAICTYLIAMLAHRSTSQQITLRNFLHLVEVNMFEKITLQQMVLNGLEATWLQVRMTSKICFKPLYESSGH